MKLPKLSIMRWVHLIKMKKVKKLRCKVANKIAVGLKSVLKICQFDKKLFEFSYFQIYNHSCYKMEGLKKYYFFYEYKKTVN